jgi:OPA family glycerol-3-phosphate transporter-like MFS transporter
MNFLVVALIMSAVVVLYFLYNPVRHSRAFLVRRFFNWFPMGMSYAFLYMARYNLNVVKNALGSSMSKEAFGIIFGVGTVVYGLSFLVNGPLVDRIGGRKGILLATTGASVANILMGCATYLFLKGQLPTDLTTTLVVLYALNMFFQSYGAVSIIKVKAYWFHVRERGLFGAIFGTLLSTGIYFAFDWNQAIADASQPFIAHPTEFQKIFGSIFHTASQTAASGVNATWLVFFIPAGILLFWTVTNFFVVKDTPSEANFEDFDTADASSGEMDRTYTSTQLLKKILTHPIILMVAAVEFTTGVTRNGILQWYFIFAKEVPQIGAEYFHNNWGFLVYITGVVGGFLSGYVSDSHFQSRRGPPVAFAAGLMLIAGAVMAFTLYSSPVAVGVCALLLGMLSISIHSLMSGTAAADFGGRKATATASGITDGFVYLGTGLQSVSLGYLTTKSWLYWPLFLIPFAMLGLVLAMRMWKSLPQATRDYLSRVEKINLDTP